MGIRKDQCNKVCRIIDDYLANRPRERDELIVAVRTVFKEADRKSEPQTETQIKTQNSNLTFEKCTMLDCYNCKRYETEDECIECHYEPKDEPQTDCSWQKGE